ncbi:hypothetical protein J437_LFUL011432 [Ladona fulva]|uniref:Uroporphyrinogen-III synthase n=1 Tax=Ladona fulva TaxID=123851 RepID=A0A8K0K2B5_LADFU|nr:hypothetical protein J437_LFUL011432 [Ladona fulva]
MEVVGKTIFILKASETADNSDPYEEIFSLSGFCPVVIPSIEFEFCNLDVLKEKLLNPLSYSGIIFTSPRSVKAVSLALENLSLPQAWTSLPTFVVGETTHQTVENSLGLHADGKECGSAKELAPVVSSREFNKPLLFPCGNLKTDALANLLSENNVSVEDVIVYKTSQHSKLKENIVTAISKGFPEYVVFFSPSGVRYAVPIMNKLTFPWKDVKVVCIGPSTETAVKEHGIEVWSVSKKPNPEFMLKAVLKQP